MTSVNPSLSALIETDLPDGWSEIRIGDYFESWGGMTPSTSNTGYWKGRIPWISSKDVKQWRIKEGQEFITNKALHDTRLRLCPIGSVLLVVRSGILAHTLPVASTDAEVAINQDLKAFYSPEPALNEWLALALRAKSSEILAINRKDGTTVQSIRYQELLDLTIQVPPLTEQKRIETKVEELLARVNTARERLARVPTILKHFRQAVLGAACSGHLTEDWRRNNPSEKVDAMVGDGDPPHNLELPDSWNWFLSLHEFTTVTSGSRGWAKYYAQNGPIFIRVGNLNHNSIELDLNSVQHVAPPSNAEGSRTRVKTGDILISITADVGMIALIDRDLHEAYINQHVALARPRGGFDRRYLAFFLASPNGGQQQFQELQRGATKVGLGLDDIRSIWIARPPLEEQTEIVRRIEALFKLADTIEKRVATATALAEKLTQAILAKAFRGEIVPTEAELAKREGRPYESASALLARIRAANHAGLGNGAGYKVRKQRNK